MTGIGGSDMSDSTCSVDGCECVACNSRGWCNKHYLRWTRHGDPLWQRTWGLPTAEQRFEQKVDRVGNPDGCWLWTGTKVSIGYGWFWHPGGTYAHRWSYQHYVGLIPDGLVIRHKCDNPPCVNPDHLLVGTQRDNIADAISRGRHSPPPILRGEAWHQAHKS